MSSPPMPFDDDLEGARGGKKEKHVEEKTEVYLCLSVAVQCTRYSGRTNHLRRRLSLLVAANLKE